jgi:hypothetical protein
MKMDLNLQRALMNRFGRIKRNGGSLEHAIKAENIQPRLAMVWTSDLETPRTPIVTVVNISILGVANCELVGYVSA